MSSLAECAIYCDQIFTFPKTVRLRISLQHISDLALLMQCNTLPHIEDLHVTMETGIYTSHQLDNWYENAPCSILCPNDLNTIGANLPHLRTLQLRQVDITNVIVLIQHVKSMCQLESLILVNCNVKDNNELIVFKSCIRNFMICLRCLRFLFYLPAETKLEKIDLDWFNLSHHTVEYEINGLMVLYTVPYPLNSQRQVYNHTFGRQSTINNNINHIEWIIDCDPLSIDTTLTHFQYVNSLVLFFDIKEMNINMDSWHVLLPFLRHLKLNFDSNPIKSGISYYQSITPSHYRCIILEQFRKCASALECLTLHWSDLELLLEHSSSPWPLVRQLNIRLKTRTDFPSASLIKQLPTNKAFPQLQYLSFSGRRFSLNPPKPLATWMLLCFDGLISSSSKFIILHVNRCYLTYRSFPLTSRDILLTLLTEHVRSRSDHYSSSKIVIDANEEIIIWL
ncbi:unnamed protein product [Rotaria sp. Silwood1]|nr:unnamed protein product [Rotaria sp. Silwood1]